MIDPIYEQLGAALKRRRTEIGMSQATLGSQLGLSRSSVTNIECGRQPMFVHQLLRAAHALGIDTHDLVVGLQMARPDAEQDAAEVYNQLLATVRFARGTGP